MKEDPRLQRSERVDVLHVSGAARLAGNLADVGGREGHHREHGGGNRLAAVRDQAVRRDHGGAQADELAGHVRQHRRGEGRARRE
ncbi:MAG: hypothetical protein XXXJIFNMEKO3_00539 [Candidatus Erwinia impunctatus]